jgi:putative transferase (TIGR04331 family)
MITTQELQEKYYKDSIYLYESSLPLISSMLGRLHNANTSPTFWEPIIGPWLLHFATIYSSRVDEFDRDTNISLELVPHKKVAAISCYGWSDFIDKCPTDRYFNLLALQYIFFKDSTRRIEDVTEWLPQENQSLKMNRSLTHYFSILPTLVYDIVCRLLILVSNLSCRDKCILVEPKFQGIKTAFNFFIKSHGKILCLPNNMLSISDRLKKHRRIRSRYDLEIRSELMKYSDSKISESVLLFLKIVCVNIPIVHVEDFYNNLQTAKKLKKLNPSVIVLSINQYFNEPLKILLAYWRQCNCKIVISQHGAGYGLLNFSSYEYYENRLGDFFASWGWESASNSFIKLPSARLSIFSEKCKTTNGVGKYILYACAPLPNFYAETLSYTPADCQAKSEARREFIEKCPISLKEKLVIRPYPPNSAMFGSCEYSEFEDAGYCIDSSDSFTNAYGKSLVVVFEGLSTGFFEAISAGVPAIIYIPNIATLRWTENGSRLVDLLRSGNMLFSNSAELIDFLTSDMDKWFASTGFYSVREEIKKSYAFSSSDFISDWCSELFRIDEAL